MTESNTAKVTTCKTMGCGKKAVTREYCKAHYCKALRNGVLSSVKHALYCTVVGCEKDRYCKGFCRAHYARFNRTGSPAKEHVEIVQEDRHAAPMSQLVAASVRRAFIKETRRQRLAKRGIVPCEI